MTGFKRWASADAFPSVNKSSRRVCSIGRVSEGAFARDNNLEEPKKEGAPNELDLEILRGDLVTCPLHIRMYTRDNLR